MDLYSVHTFAHTTQEEEEEEEELRSLFRAGVNKVSVRRTPVTKPQGIGVGCNTTSPFTGSRHYFK
jgi:hypothetical protein